MAWSQSRHAHLILRTVRRWLQIGTVVGLLGLAIAGVAASGRVNAPFRPAIFDLHPTLGVVLLWLSVPLVLALFVFRAMRARRESSRSSVRRWLAIVGVLLLVWLLRDIIDRGDGVELPETPPLPEAVPQLLPSWTPSAAGTVALLLIAAGALLVWRSRRRPPATAWPSSEPPDARPDESGPATLATSGLDGLRDRLIGYYALAEREVAGAGAPRRPTETVGEYVDRVSAAGLVPPQPARELSRLYQVARFSRHDVSPGDLDAAQAARADLAAALRRSTDEGADPSKPPALADDP